MAPPDLKEVSSRYGLSAVRQTRIKADLQHSRSAPSLLSLSSPCSTSHSRSLTAPSSSLYFEDSSISDGWLHGERGAELLGDLTADDFDDWVTSSLVLRPFSGDGNASDFQGAPRTPEPDGDFTAAPRTPEPTLRKCRSPGGVAEALSASYGLGSSIQTDLSDDEEYLSVGDIRRIVTPKRSPSAPGRLKKLLSGKSKEGSDGEDQGFDGNDQCRSLSLPAHQISTSSTVSTVHSVSRPTGVVLSAEHQRLKNKLMAQAATIKHKKIEEKRLQGASNRVSIALNVKSERESMASAIRQHIGRKKKTQAHTTSNYDRSKDPEKNPFVTYEDKELKLQQKRKWLCENPHYLEDQIGALQQNRVQTMLWDQTRSQEIVYEDRMFYGDYSMHMKAQKEKRAEIQRFHDDGRGEHSRNLTLKVEKLGESINKSTQHMVSEGSPSMKLGDIFKRQSARQHGVAAAMAKLKLAKANAGERLVGKEIQKQRDSLIAEGQSKQEKKKDNPNEFLTSMQSLRLYALKKRLEDSHNDMDHGYGPIIEEEEHKKRDTFTNLLGGLFGKSRAQEAEPDPFSQPEESHTEHHSRGRKSHAVTRKSHAVSRKSHVPDGRKSQASRRSNSPAVSRPSQAPRSSNSPPPSRPSQAPRSSNSPPPSRPSQAPKTMVLGKSFIGGKAKKTSMSQQQNLGGSKNTRVSFAEDLDISS